MRTTSTSHDTLAIFERMAGDLEAARDRLNELDAAVGDGDQGVTVTIGFRSVREVLPSLRGQDVGTIVARAGLAFNGKAASTTGALLATGRARAGKEARGKQEIDLSDLARMVEAAVAGIREHGAAEGLAFDEALRRSLAAAEEGMRSTIPLKSKIGRASWLADRTVGQQGPSATGVGGTFPRRAVRDILAPPIARTSRRRIDVDSRK